MNCNEFSYDVYGSLLDSLLSTRRNLRFRDVQEELQGDPYVILRHDVDYSPEAALQMAEFEAEKGVKSTYFVLFSSQYYNLFDFEHTAFPEKLVALGHEVGLHYDVQSLEKFQRSGQDEYNALYQQIRLLSSLSGSPVSSISMHNPSLSGADPYVETEFINAYDRKYVKDISYFSDSCGAWRDEFVACIEQNTFPDRMQLLIHPIFWQFVSRNRWQTLDVFHETLADRFARYKEETHRLWKDHAGVKQHEKRLVSPPSLPSSHEKNV